MSCGFSTRKVKICVRSLSCSAKYLCSWMDGAIHSTPNFLCYSAWAKKNRFQGESVHSSWIQSAWDTCFRLKLKLSAHRPNCNFLNDVSQRRWRGFPATKSNTAAVAVTSGQQWTFAFLFLKAAVPASSDTHAKHRVTTRARKHKNR